MKKVALILSFFISIVSIGQTFTSSPSLAVPNLTTVTDEIVVSGVGQMDCDYGLGTVCINVTHSRVADMDIFLIDPIGNVIELTTDNGGGGDDYVNTCFNMTVATSITSVAAGDAPFTGTFIPEGDISDFNDGHSADGTWTLQVTDDRSGRAGTLDSWSLDFQADPPCATETFTAFPGSFISDFSTVTSTINVSGIGVIGCYYGLEQVCIDVSHTFDGDLDIFLSDPQGTSYELTTDNGGSGNSYSVTCFNMAATTAVTAGTAPFNGDFIPEGDISLANNGQNADGNWILSVSDDGGGDNGFLNGWSLSFGPSPECPPVSGEDCAGGTTLCSDATFTGNSSGSGNITDLISSNDGCLNGENESSWYYFQAATDGDYAFEIVTSVDYDFAVWGPLNGVYCPPEDSPLRCSYSGAGGRTGLRSTSSDFTEGSGGDGFVAPITASAGEIFIMAIDNFSEDGTSYDLEFTLTSGGSLDCTPLPVELVSFKGENVNYINTLEWVTVSEVNNAFFSIERSSDGINWEVLDNVMGAGNSTSELVYNYRDDNYPDVINYYRLSQTDFDGTRVPVHTIAIDNSGGVKQVVKMINLMGQEIDASYQGVQIHVYSDGTTKRVVAQN